MKLYIKFYMYSKDSAIPGTAFFKTFVLEMLPRLFLCSLVRLRLGEIFETLMGVNGGVSCSVICSKSPAFASVALLISVILGRIVHWTCMVFHI